MVFVEDWLCDMQQLERIESAYLQPPPTKDVSLAMPSHILLYACYVSRRFHGVGLGSTGIACVGCYACVCVLGGSYSEDNSNNIESANPEHLGTPFNFLENP